MRHSNGSPGTHLSSQRSQFGSRGFSVALIRPNDRACAHRSRAVAMASTPASFHHRASSPRHSSTVNSSLTFRPSARGWAKRTRLCDHKIVTQARSGDTGVTELDNAVFCGHASGGIRVRSATLIRQRKLASFRNRDRYAAGTDDKPSGRQASQSAATTLRRRAFQHRRVVNRRATGA